MDKIVVLIPQGRQQISCCSVAYMCVDPVKYVLPHNSIKITFDHFMLLSLLVTLYTIEQHVTYLLTYLLA